MSKAHSNQLSIELVSKDEKLQEEWGAWIRICFFIDGNTLKYHQWSNTTLLKTTPLFYQPLIFLWETSEPPFLGILRKL